MLLLLYFVAKIRSIILNHHCYTCYWEFVGLSLCAWLLKISSSSDPSIAYRLKNWSSIYFLSFYVAISSFILHIWPIFSQISIFTFVLSFCKYLSSVFFYFLDFFNSFTNSSFSIFIRLILLIKSWYAFEEMIYKWSVNLVWDIGFLSIRLSLREIGSN